MFTGNIGVVRLLCQNLDTFRYVRPLDSLLTEHFNVFLARKRMYKRPSTRRVCKIGRISCTPGLLLTLCMYSFR